jgi:hypothetical protein
MQRKLTRQQPDSNPNARLLCNARTGSLLAYQAIRPYLRARAKRERDIGERDIGERDIPERDIRERASARPSPPNDSPSSCCSTSTAEVFLAASASRSIDAAGQSFCGVTSPKNSSPLRI